MWEARAREREPAAKIVPPPQPSIVMSSLLISIPLIFSGMMAAVPRTAQLVAGTGQLFPGTGKLFSGTGKLVLGTGSWSQEPGSYFPEPSSCSLEPCTSQ